MASTGKKVKEGFYFRIYSNLVSENVNKKRKYFEGHSGLHCHHIVPRHQGGTDDESNFAYLTVREHIIAHFLLWKMHGDPNDLRSMKMLGANLTVEQRRAVGKMCAEKKIGFFNEKWVENGKRKEWGLRGVEKQIENKQGIFNPDMMSYHGRLGGIATAKSKKRCIFGIYESEKNTEAAKQRRREICVKGGKAMTGMYRMWKDGVGSRFKAERVFEMDEQGWKLYKGDGKKGNYKFHKGDVIISTNGEMQIEALRLGWNRGFPDDYVPNPKRKKIRKFTTVEQIIAAEPQPAPLDAFFS